MALPNGKNSKVLIDSDAFIGIMVESDIHHDRATQILEVLKSAQTSLFISNFVISEVITVLGLRSGRASALDFIRVPHEHNNGFITAYMDESLQDQAISIYRKQTSKNVSFVDCLNMAFMEKEGIETIFGFDKIYGKNGFTYVELDDDLQGVT